MTTGMKCVFHPEREKGSFTSHCITRSDLCHLINCTVLIDHGNELDVSFRMATTTEIATASAVMTAGAFPPALPPEIWGQIFIYVDSFTLWTSCRNVSQMLRQDAEGEIARARLLDLEIKWTCHNLLDHRWQEVPILKTCKFLKLSKDQSRAHFGLWTGYRDCAAAGIPSLEIEGFDNVPWDANHTDKIFTEAIKFSDLELFDRAHERLPWKMLEITFERFVNDPDIPGLAVSSDWRELSFEWRELLTRFYVDEQYVCSMKRKAAPDTLVLPYNERAEKSLETHKLRKAWCCRDKWERYYANEDTPLYQKANWRRVRRSHQEAGKMLNIDDLSYMAKYELRKSWIDLRYCRNTKVMRQLLTKRPNEFLQMRAIC
ncbi:hypothetical protein K458DRAFT_391224 [Lentithecium fluviatile CBS 122367]|uniref:F-box domain-containing protein n=1 Tax=Lentithecium fluviatile CBS 122367 TaxID=1168545 RepID=A0A6G1IVR2_9PLEO|nr:hypothetical protein K458DRAFT_391224 [Lentithecium fluviatile CBS 122367]